MSLEDDIDFWDGYMDALDGNGGSWYDGGGGGAPYDAGLIATSDVYAPPDIPYTDDGYTGLPWFPTYPEYPTYNPTPTPTTGCPPCSTGGIVTVPVATTPKPTTPKPTTGGSGGSGSGASVQPKPQTTPAKKAEKEAWMWLLLLGVILLASSQEG